MYCYKCGKNIEEARYCRWCGADQEEPGSDGDSTQKQEERKKADSSSAPSCALPTSGEDVSMRQVEHEVCSDNAASDLVSTNDGDHDIKAPALRSWKTSVGFSILGAFAICGLSGIVEGVAAQIMLDSPTLGFLIAILYPALLGVTGILYAIKVYASLFTEKPSIRSSSVISFLNFVCGGYIFGAIWNGNLTKKVKGISYKVFVAMQACALVLLLAYAGLMAYQDFSSESAPSTTPSASVSSITTPSTVSLSGYSFEVDSSWAAYKSEEENAAGYATNTYRFLFNEEEDSFTDLHIVESEYYGSIFTTMLAGDIDNQRKLLESIYDTEYENDDGTISRTTLENIKQLKFGDYAAQRASLSVYKDDELVSKMYVFDFFVDSGYLVQMKVRAYPDDFEKYEELATEVFDSVKSK